MQSIVSSIAIAALVFAAIRPVDAQLVARKDLSLAVAKVIADTAVSTCSKLGYNISVHVVDRGGHTIVSYRGDGSGVHTIENSQRKAFTAMTFARPSAEFGERLAKGDTGAELQLMLSGMSGQQGGLPIRVGKDVIGGVGASGAGMGADTTCVQAGLDAVADQLK
jgi:uncharacterized protein GlcG (DUF336 family)